MPRAKKSASTTKVPAKPASKARAKPASTKRALDSDSDDGATGPSAKKTKKSKARANSEEDDVADDSNLVTVKKRGAAPVDPHSPYVGML